MFGESVSACSLYIYRYVYWQAIVPLVLDGHQWASMGINGHQWASMGINMWAKLAKTNQAT